MHGTRASGHVVLPLLAKLGAGRIPDFLFHKLVLGLLLQPGSVQGSGLGSPAAGRS